MATILDRFVSKLQIEENGCWIWSGATSKNGYGQIKVERCVVYAHRLAYQLFVGEIPDGLTIDHLCRERLCVNPAHLEAVALRVNILRGESPSAKQARQTHCGNGHVLAGENLVVRHGKRGCRICIRAAQKVRSRRFRQRHAQGVGLLQPGR